MSALRLASVDVSALRTACAPCCATADASALESDWAPACAGATSAVGRSVPAADVASRIAMSDPCDTLSPSLTFTSFTTPACEEGTSIVALSLSSVTSEASFSTRSPGFTSTSMTGTSLKSPMSGTLISMAAMAGPLQDAAPEVGDDLGEVAREARGRCAVDDAVVVRERQRQHLPRRELAAVPHGPGRRLRDAEDRDLGRVDDRSERGAADAAERRDRERAALHVGGSELAFARLRRELRGFLRDLDHALLVGVLHHGHDEAL